MGVNDGGVKRGDREETGDLEARPRKDVSRGGSGVAGGRGGAEGAPTADPSALSGNPPIPAPNPDDGGSPQTSQDQPD
jgi:hypothetical protein